jgi:hypothetical protein
MDARISPSPASRERVASLEGEPGEGFFLLQLPSPSHAFGVGPSLSRDAGEGLIVAPAMRRSFGDVE